MENKEYKSIRPSFMFLLNEIPRGKIKGVEIGTSIGENAIRMLDFCDRLELVCVDIDKPQAMQGIMNNYGERVRFIQKRSVKAAKDFPNDYFDYIYIDGAHDVENVFQDIKAWYPKLRVNGIMSGHDWWLESVRQGVAKFLDTSDWHRLFAVQSYYTKEHFITSHHAEFMDWWFEKHPEDYYEKASTKEVL